LLYGSVAEQVLHGSTTPVLMVPPMAVFDWESKEHLRVIAALDGSRVAEKALPFLSLLVRQLGAEVILVRAVEPPNYWAAANPFAVESESSARKIAAETYLKAVASTLAGIHVSTHVEPGLASDVITEAVRRFGGDIVVMATHGRSGVPRVILGNVADSVLGRSTVPVVLVRPGSLGHAVSIATQPRAEREPQKPRVG
jgi:nucleotide-binding universal stress UspA family protein